MKRLYIDFESTMKGGKGEIDEFGADNYLRANELTYASWAVDDGEVHVAPWCMDTQDTITETAGSVDAVVAHNAVFDMLCIQNYFNAGNAWCMMANRLECTKTMCQRLNLPSSLRDASTHLGLGEKLPMPNSMFAAEDDWLEYNAQDVKLCRALHAKLAKAIPAHEFDVMDCHIRTMLRGVHVDLATLQAELERQTAFLADIDRKFKLITGYQPTQAAMLCEWFDKRCGVRSSSIKQLGRLDPETLEKPVRDAIKLLDKRRENERAKLESLGKQVSPDGRLRDTLWCDITMTNRWSGKGAHLHNAKRGGVVRSLVKAQGGKYLYSADLSQVEVRMGLWVAGMLDAVKDLHNRDWYMSLAQAIYGKDATQEHRRRVKQGVIGAMYAGGAKALQMGINGTLKDAQFLHEMSGRMLKPIVTLSHRLLETAKACVGNGTPLSVELHSNYSVDFKMSGKGTLMMRLPYRGIVLHYHNAHMDGNQIKYKKRGQPCWLKHRGDLYEHICSSMCRELLAVAMVELDAMQGVQVVYTIHDEVLMELDSPELGDGVLAKMTKPGQELDGLLLAAEGGVRECWVDK